MDSLPLLPFEKVLSYLSLDELILSRAVSRSWRACIDNLKANSLCYSGLKRGHLYEKHRLISGRFDRNFIGSHSFESVFNCFAKSIFSDLKHLRICSLAMESGLPLVQALNSFGKLEELDLINLHLGPTADSRLNLPSLQSIQIEDLTGFDELTLDAPQLQRIKLWICPFRSAFRRLEIVHVESVERVVTYSMRHLDVKKFKNLKYIAWSDFRSASCLSNLKQLQEIHLTGGSVHEVFKLKRQYKKNKCDLKIYFCGLQLDYSNDLRRLPVNDNGDYFPPKEYIDYYVENSARLADEFRVGYQSRLDFSKFENTVSRTPVDFWKRFANLNEIIVSKPICPRSIREFLQFLENLENVAALRFESRQPQDLYDRLPGHCSIQNLWISVAKNLNLEFLFGLKHLTYISLGHRVSTDFILRVFKEFEFILTLNFLNRVGSTVDVQLDESKRFAVSVGGSKAVFESLNKAFIPMNL